MDALALRAGERVLLVGAGTGEDLPFIPAEVFTVATDLTPAMLWRARHKARDGDQLAVMDGHALALRNGTFDAVVLPSPKPYGVLRAGGRIAVLDKFVADRQKASIGRRLLNRVTRPIATDITRRLDDIIRDSGVRIRRTANEPALGGLFTITRLFVPAAARE